MRDLYAVLGVRRDAKPDTIRRAYRKKAAKLHPDRNPGDPAADAAYKELVDAYEVLSDPARRQRYDETGDPTAPRTTADGEVLSILVPCMIECLQAITAGYNGGPDAVCKKNVLNAMKTSITGAIARQKDQLKAITNGVKALTNAVGRFSRKDAEPNLLDDVVNTKLREVKAEQARCEAEIEKLQRALAHADRYVYRTDSDPPAASSSTGGSYRVIPSSSATW